MATETIKRQARVLLVDDEKNFRLVISNELERKGFEVEARRDGVEALAAIKEFRPEVILVDLQMPGMDGLTLLRKLKGMDDSPEAIVITGHSTVHNAVEAMKLGAVDYIAKPFDLEELAVVIRKARENWSLKRQNRMLRSELGGRSDPNVVVGSSLVIKQLWNIIERVGPTNAATLVQGESGSGKELVSRAVHKHSPRRNNPFIVVDCCSLQSTLLENELFGHEAGAYTGAARMKHGLFEVADSGTIFMDEIGEISPEIQSKLLRVLETGSFRRLGSTRNTQVDVRVIAATNRNLRRLIDEGRFREDLYYRLTTVTISVPPLRERKEDIPVLIDHFIKTSRLPGAETKVITENVMERLISYEWWGNVRELKNAVKRAIILSDSDELKIEDFHLLSRPAAGHSQADSCAQSVPQWSTLSEIEKDYIRKVLSATNGHRRRTAEILGISERSLYRKIKGFNEGE